MSIGDVYSSPEDYQLVQFGSVEEPEDYDFDMLVVWQKTDTGVLYWAHDAGCSCPSPFESYQSVESLNQLRPDTFEPFRAEVDAMDVSVGDRAVLLEKVKAVLGRQA